MYVEAWLKKWLDATSKYGMRFVELKTRRPTSVYETLNNITFDLVYDMPMRNWWDTPCDGFCFSKCQTALERIPLPYSAQIEIDLMFKLINECNLTPDRAPDHYWDRGRWANVTLEGPWQFSSHPPYVVAVTDHDKAMIMLKWN